MKREIRKNVHLLASIDWHRRLFDALIPLPDGTSYNSYLVCGSDKTALVDSSDPSMAATLMDQLADVRQIDFIVSNHTEQDHSGMIPTVMQKYPHAVVLASEKGKPMLVEHLAIPADRVRAVRDGETLSLGDKTLQFIYTPWVHWPETMSTFLVEDKILFSCDFFGSHLATSALYADNDAIILEAAKRYYAEIMMPFRQAVANNLRKLEAVTFDLIAPSHGPLHADPSFIVSAYREWAEGAPRNLALVPFISMHGSTARLVDCLVGSLVENGVAAQPFDLAVTDIGKLAIALVDAATIVLATPTVHLGPHPAVNYAAALANSLRPKARFASIVGSYGWNTRVVESISALIPNLKVDILGSVLCKGLPRDKDYAAVSELARAIAGKHRELSLK